MASLSLVASQLLAEARLNFDSAVGASRAWQEWDVKVTIFACRDGGKHDHVHASCVLRTELPIPEDADKAAANFADLLGALGCPDIARSFIADSGERLHFGWRSDKGLGTCRGDA